MHSKRGSAAVVLLPCWSGHICMFASVLCVHVCFRCVMLCWQPAGMSGVARAALQLNFMRALASVRLLFLLSAAFCYDPWPRLAKSVSQSSQTIVVGLCIWVTKQPLACSHCRTVSCRVAERLSLAHTKYIRCALNHQTLKTWLRVLIAINWKTGLDEIRQPLLLWTENICRPLKFKTD